MNNYYQYPFNNFPMAYILQEGKKIPSQSKLEKLTRVENQSHEITAFFCWTYISRIKSEKKVHPLPLWYRGFWLIRDHFAFNHPFVICRSSMNPFSYWSSSSGFFDKWTARVRRTLANKVIAQGVSSFMEENSGHVSICCLCKKKFYNFLLQPNNGCWVISFYFANHSFYIGKSIWH